MIYRYDGSFDGVMTAIFEVFEKKDNNASIVPENRPQNMSMFETLQVETDFKKSVRLQRGYDRLGGSVSANMYQAWLSQEDGVEDLMLACTKVGFKRKVDPFTVRQLDAVVKLSSLSRKVGWEAHRMLQFVRFRRIETGNRSNPDERLVHDSYNNDRILQNVSEIQSNFSAETQLLPVGKAEVADKKRYIEKPEDCIYAAEIEPEFEVLGLIGRHFHGRFPNSRFVIDDRRHGRMIVASPQGWHITETPPGFSMPQDGGIEQLWRMYFETIAIEQRRNLKLQQQFVPKKYRGFITEFTDGTEK